MRLAQCTWLWGHGVMQGRGARTWCKAGFCRFPVWFSRLVFQFGSPLHLAAPACNPVKTTTTISYYSSRTGPVKAQTYRTAETTRFEQVAPENGSAFLQLFFRCRETLTGVCGRLVISKRLKVRVRPAIRRFPPSSLRLRPAAASRKPQAG